MKKPLPSLVALGLAATLAWTLAACSNGADAAAGSGGSDGATGTASIRIGAAPTPHAKILEFIQDNLAQDAGITLDIVEYTDETRLNQLVADGDLDANYFQHKPYFDSQVEEFGYELTALEGVHIEPYALYSKKVTDIGDLADGATIAVTNDPVNLGRALDLLETGGLITVSDTGDKDPTLLDIAENPNDLEFIETDPAQLVRALDDVDGAVINGNYALDGGLNPTEDGLLVESGVDNPYANFVAVKTSRASEEAIQTLDKLLHSDEVKAYIEQTWPSGEVLPAF
jgi:D-methionine transport system substrate-binding protein